jgi:sterol desaturase/sphingolipid hydroxylase (fatty acid hydroxylase superfamily)
MSALEQYLLAHESAIRLGVFFAMFVLVALWELVQPRRVLTVSKARRWANNLGLSALNTLLLRLLFPTAAVGVAALAAGKGWGLLHYFSVPLPVAIPLAVLALDFLIWLQHVVFHAVPALWRLHRVHHADLDYDLTTGSRFHPIEMGLSMLLKMAAILLLGASVTSVVVFEILLSAGALFNHGNIRLPAALDRVLRWFIVTPDMHRVHHSVEDDETNSNFGFSVSLWDRIMGTYRAQARAGQLGMTIGIRNHTEPSEVVALPGLLRMPFKGEVSDYAINRRTW